MKIHSRVNGRYLSFVRGRPITSRKLTRGRRAKGRYHRSTAGAAGPGPGQTVTGISLKECTTYAPAIIAPATIAPMKATIAPR